MAETEAQTAAIIIAAYNAEATIARAVRSALAERAVAQVCVVDDASSDGTAAAARACDLGDGRLIVLVQPANAGPSAARNVAIEATQAPWVGVLDADDYLLPGRTAALLARSGEADFIADALLRVRDGAPAPSLAPDLAGAAAANAPGVVGDALSFEAFVLGNLKPAKGSLEYGYLKPLMRRAFLDRFEVRYRPEMRLGEDYELYARAIAHGARFQLTPPAGYVSVERANSLSNRHGIEDLRLLRDCDAALTNIRSLSAAEQHALTRHMTSVDCRLQWRLLIEAVKVRDLKASLATFRSPAVALYLTARLGEQVWLRSLARLGFGRPSDRAAS